MRPAIFVGIGVCAGLLCGCSANPGSMAMSAANAGVSVVKGAEAHVIPLREPTSVRDYSSLKLGEVTTDVPGIVSADVIMAVRGAFREELADKDTAKTFPGGGKALTVNVVCRFYKEKPLIGKESRLDMLVTLADPDGTEVGRVYIEGLSDSLRAHGKSDLAKKNAEKLVSFLKDRKRGKK